MYSNVFVLLDLCGIRYHLDPSERKKIWIPMSVAENPSRPFWRTGFQSRPFDYFMDLALKYVFSWYGERMELDRVQELMRFRSNQVALEGNLADVKR